MLSAQGRNEPTFCFPVISQRTQVAPRSHECFLDQVVGLSRITAEREYVTVQVPREGLNHRLELLLCATL